MVYHSDAHRCGRDGLRVVSAPLMGARDPRPRAPFLAEAALPPAALAEVEGVVSSGFATPLPEEGEPTLAAGEKA